MHPGKHKRPLTLQHVKHDSRVSNGDFSREFEPVRAEPSGKRCSARTARESGWSSFLCRCASGSSLNLSPNQPVREVGAFVRYERRRGHSYARFILGEPWNSTPFP